MEIPSVSPWRDPSDRYPYWLPSVALPSRENPTIKEPPIFTSSETTSPAKAAFLEHFWRSHQAAYPAWREGGLLEPDARNIARHQVITGVLAAHLADLTGLIGQEKEDCITAAMIHDAYKLREAKSLDLAMANPRKSSRRGQKNTILTDIKAREQGWLSSLGFSEDVIHLAGANVPRIPHDIDASTPSLYGMARKIVDEMSVAESIIWFVDGIVLGEQVVGVTLRMRTARGFGEPTTQREMRNQFINTVMGKHFGTDYNDLQEMIGRIIEGRLSRLIVQRQQAFHFLEQPDKSLAGFLDDSMDKSVKAFVGDKN